MPIIIKSEEEIALIRDAGRVVGQAQLRDQVARLADEMARFASRPISPDDPA